MKKIIFNTTVIKVEEVSDKHFVVIEGKEPPESTGLVYNITGKPFRVSVDLTYMHPIEAGNIRAALTKLQANNPIKAMHSFTKYDDALDYLRLLISRDKKGIEKFTAEKMGKNQLKSMLNDDGECCGMTLQQKTRKAVDNLGNMVDVKVK